MRLLPFMDVPLVDEDAPSGIERFTGLVEWANGDKAKLSAAFLAYENDGDKIEDYLFQIAYILNECLVTNKQVIEETGNACREYREWKEQTKLLFEVQRHLEFYYEKINSIPPWGSSKYVELLDQKYTPRVLHGPHKVGRLRPNQKRMIILDSTNEIVFGPLL